MTDLQIRAQGNIIEQQKADAARMQAEAARQQAINTWYRDQETKRSNMTRETLEDLENQMKYGYDRYFPITDEGHERRKGPIGVLQILPDYMENKVGKILAPFGSIFKGLLG